MKQDVYCGQICISSLGRKESSRISPNKTIRAIRKRYHNNWMVDNLPALSRKYDSALNQSQHFLGFPLGFIFEKRAYVYNHVNIYLDYHKVDRAELDTETSEDEYRIVKFVVEPMSIHHSFKPLAAPDDDAVIHKKMDGNENVAKLLNPIVSCDYKLTKLLQRHTSFDMVNTEGGSPGPQKSSRHMLFTYDVIWKENSDVSWTSRWDMYLDLQDAESNGEVSHWISVSNSIMMVLSLSISMFLLLIRNLRLDYHLYCQPSIDVELQDNDYLEKRARGWHTISYDVFRAPPYPLVLSVLCGTGFQISCMMLLTVVFVMLGTFSPDERESLVMVLMSLYGLMGYFAGYVTGYLYKSFKGTSLHMVASVLSFGFPSLVFATVACMNIIASKQNNESKPLNSLLYYLVLWLGLSSPLVFLGSRKGHKAGGFEYPVNTNRIPRKISRQPLLMNSTVTSYFSSLIPFGVCFYEVMNIMTSVWVDEYYYIFGFLGLTVVSLLFTSSQMAVFVNYHCLKSEDYRWWWRSFFTGASCALHIFVYALYYSTKLESKNAVTYILYYGYMGLVCLGLGLGLGTFSLMSSLCFNKWLYKVYISRCLKLS